MGPGNAMLAGETKSPVINVPVLSKATAWKGRAAFDFSRRVMSGGGGVTEWGAAVDHEGSPLKVQFAAVAAVYVEAV